MRLILAALTFLWLSQSALACASGRFESFDWGNPVYAPQDKQKNGATYVIGRVISFYGKTDRLGQSARSGGVMIEVLKIYTYGSNPIELKEIRAHFSGTSCGGALGVGQIGVFAFKTEDGKHELLSYTFRF
jgi:hypothetical protein